MSDFEHDDDLRDALRRAHPARNEAGPTLAATRDRMARARTRRRAAIGSIAAASFVAVGAAVFAANTTSDTNVVDVVGPPGTVVTVSTTEPAERPGSTTTVSSSTTSTTTTRSGSDQTTTIAPAPPPSSTQTTTATTPASTTGPGRTIHSSQGGTITVRHTATAITVEQITDVAGWTHTVNKNDSDDVEVEWRRSNPEDHAKVRLRLVDGTIREEIE